MRLHVFHLVRRLARQLGQALEEQQGQVPPSAGELLVGELVIGVDRQCTLGPQLQVDAEVLAEPLALAIAVAPPPVGLLLGKLVGRQDGRLQELPANGMRAPPTADGTDAASRAPTCSNRPKGCRDEQTEHAAAHVKQRGGALVDPVPQGLRPFRAAPRSSSTTSAACRARRSARVSRSTSICASTAAERTCPTRSSTRSWDLARVNAAIVRQSNAYVRG